MKRSEFDNAGRNDPCPCGSGKKYKKCCMNTVKRGFTAKVLKGGSGLGLSTLMSSAASQIENDEKAFEKKQREKKQDSSSSADKENS